jgi:hypothetical protein
MISAAEKRRYKALAAWVAIVGLLLINAGLLVMLIRGRDSVPNPPAPTPVVDVMPEVVAAAKSAAKSRSAALSRGYTALAANIEKQQPRHAKDVLDAVGKVVADGDAAAAAEVAKVTAGLPDGDMTAADCTRVAKFFRSLAAGFAEVAK